MNERTEKLVAELASLGETANASCENFLEALKVLYERLEASVDDPDIDQDIKNKCFKQIGSVEALLGMLGEEI